MWEEEGRSLRLSPSASLAVASSPLPIWESQSARLGELGNVVSSGAALLTDTTSLASPNAMVTSVAAGEGSEVAGGSASSVSASDTARTAVLVCWLGHLVVGRNPSQVHLTVVLAATHHKNRFYAEPRNSRLAPFCSVLHLTGADNFGSILHYTVVLGPCYCGAVATYPAADYPARRSIPGSGAHRVANIPCLSIGVT